MKRILLALLLIPFIVPAAPVETKPALIASPTLVVTISGNNTFCPGGGTVLTATVTGNVGAFTYQWRRNGSNINGATAQTYNATQAGDYTVRVTDTVPPVVTSAVFAVSQSNLNALAIGGPGEFCAGGSITLAANFTGGTGPYTYQWKNGATNVGTNSSTLSVNSAGSYTVVITDGRGCTDTSPAKAVTQNPLPVANAGPGGSFTGTETYSLASVTTGSGGTGNLTYAWSTNPGGVPINNPAAAKPVIGPFTQNVNVQLTVTDSKSCSASSTAAVTFVPCTVTATVAANPSNGVICTNGQTVTLTVTPGGGSAPYAYQWKKDGGNTGPNGATLTVNAGGSYTVTVTDSKGCAVTSAATVVVVSDLAAGIPGGPAEFCAGGGTTLSANRGGGAEPFSYQWKKDGVNVGTNAPTLPVNAAGSYTLVITDGRGCSVTSPAKVVTQNPLPSANAGPGGSFTGTQTYSLAGVTTGSGGTGNLTYAWSTNPGGVPILPNAGNATPTIGPFTQSTTVQLTVTDSKGCSATSSSAISFVPCTVTASVNASPSDVICTPGQTITLTVTAGGGSPGYTYQWKKDGVVVGTNAPTLPVTAAGSYTVTVTDTKGCAITPAATNVSVSNLAAGVPNGASEFCANGSINLTANQSGGVGPFSYQWRNGANNVGGNANTLPVNGAGAYSVVITDSKGCSVTSQAKNVAVNPVPTASAGSGRSLVCEEQYNLAGVTVATGGTPGYTYQWSVSPGAPINTTGSSNPVIGPFSNTGTYNVTVLVTDSKGCQASQTAQVTKNNNPLTVNISAPFNTICPGATVALSSNVGGNSGDPNFQWQNDGNNIGGQTGSVFVAGNEGNYRVVVGDNRGCRAESNSIRLSNSNLSISISSSTNFRYCEKGQSNFAQLTGNASGGAGSYQYRWYGGNAFNQTSQRVDVFAGYFSVEVTDAQGCKVRTNDVEVFALQRPTANAGPGIVLTGDEKYDLTKVANFAPATGGKPGYNFQWTSLPDTSAKSTAEKPVLGEFTRSNVVSLIVTDANGCISDIDTARVTYLPCQLTNRIVGNNYVCTNNTTTLTANAANGWGDVKNYRYRWQLANQLINTDSVKVSVNRGGLYTLTAIDTRGCRKVDTIQVAQLPELLVAVSGPASYCRGSNESLVARVTNGAPKYVFEWLNGGVPLAGDSARYFLQGGGNYTVKVTDSRGCTGVLAQPVAVVEKGQTLSAIVIPPNGPTTVYAPATVTLTAQTGADYTYQWLKDTKEIPGATTTTYEVTPQKDPGKAAYAIRVGNSEGCFATSQALTVEVIIPTAVGPVRIGEFSMRAFPSPTTGRLQVEVSLEKAAPATLHLTDLSGRTLTTRASTQPGTRHAAEFDLSAQPNGLYLLRVEAEGRQTVQKVLKAN